MEAANFPFHHSSDLFEQCLSFSNTATTTTTATGCSGNEFNQPHDQALLNASIEDIAANKSCKRRQGKRKKIIDDQENSKKMRDSKGEGQSGYIHVRARRGEATDSHSLAERVRRERINEKMKTLQAIVPGCDKITGKALMLEEVINYVHSLQNQIQILSFKLTSVNPMFGVASDASMITPDQNTTTYQEQLMLLQEDQMPCMISQNNEEIMWDIGEQRQELDDLFAIINNFNTF